MKKDMDKERKGHHFRLGGQSQDYTTEKGDKIVPHEVKPFKQFRLPDTLCLTDETKSNRQNTEYYKAYPKYERTDAENQPNKRRARSSDVTHNFSFEHAGGNFQTEKDSNYLNFGNEDIEIQKNRVEDCKVVAKLKLTDVASFKNDSNNRFVTEQKGQFHTEENDIKSCRGKLQTHLRANQNAHQHVLGEDDKPTKESQYGKYYSKSVRDPIVKPNVYRVPPAYSIGHNSRREFRTTNRAQYVLKETDVAL